MSIIGDSFRAAINIVMEAKKKASAEQKQQEESTQESEQKPAEQSSDIKEPPPAKNELRQRVEAKEEKASQEDAVACQQDAKATAQANNSHHLSAAKSGDQATHAARKTAPPGVMAQVKAARSNEAAISSRPAPSQSAAKTR